MFPDLWELKRNELDIEESKEKLKAAWWAIGQANNIDKVIEVSLSATLPLHPLHITIYLFI